MNSVEEMQRNARLIRERLRRPPNAVPDKGINITRISSGVKGDGVPAYTPRVNVDPQPPEPKVHESVKMPLTFNRILKVVADFYGLEVNDLVTGKRLQRLTKARWMAVHLGIKLLKNRSIASMAREMKKDHTSLLYARDEMDKYVSNNEMLRRVVNSLEEVVLANHH